MEKFKEIENEKDEEIKKLKAKVQGLSDHLDK